MSACPLWLPTHSSNLPGCPPATSPACPLRRAECTLTVLPAVPTHHVCPPAHIQVCKPQCSRNSSPRLLACPVACPPCLPIVSARPSTYTYKFASHNAPATQDLACLPALSPALVLRKHSIRSAPTSTRFGMCRAAMRRESLGPFSAFCKPTATPATHQQLRHTKQPQASRQNEVEISSDAAAADTVARRGRGPSGAGVVDGADGIGDM
ncbi:hypothetical protein GGX14DRAFT_600772 [Mycena pura]|uniref:Uncharacterized protein n=1 Tax=Mycena pura TaxID=153505 RepID=A0AAD6URJ4_9AGAR|nr:hypothetical protein GGX14DRAFT_600772 [Mycena pura]